MVAINVFQYTSVSGWRTFCSFMPPFITPTGHERSLNFASACGRRFSSRSLSRLAPLGSLCYSVTDVTCYLLYPIVSDVSLPSFISRRHVYPAFAVLFHRYPPLLRCRASFRISACHSRINSFLAFVSPNAPFLFRFTFSLLHLFVSFVSLLSLFWLSSVPRRTFHASFPQKVRVTISTFLRSLQSSRMPLSFYVSHLGILCIWESLFELAMNRAMSSMFDMHNSLHLKLRWTARWSYMFKILPIHPLKCLPSHQFQTILLKNGIWI